ncbi:MAG: DUF1772 domain-containing protein [Sphingomonadales bacterium]|nr:DUF1772 domain-containing protein [Sphingomonadales bacterium]
MLYSILALLIATAFASAALYITLVEHPARMALPDEFALAQWQPSYARALPIQGGLAVLGSVAGVLAWYRTGAVVDLAGSLLLFANWPFTLAAIMPVNGKLNATSPAAAGPDVRQLLQRWGTLHAVRGVLGSLAAGAFVAGLPTISVH